MDTHTTSLTTTFHAFLFPELDVVQLRPFDASAECRAEFTPEQLEALSTFDFSGVGGTLALITPHVLNVQFAPHQEHPLGPLAEALTELFEYVELVVSDDLMPDHPEPLTALLAPDGESAVRIIFGEHFGADYIAVFLATQGHPTVALAEGGLRLSRDPSTADIGRVHDELDRQVRTRSGGTRILVMLPAPAGLPTSA